MVRLLRPAPDQMDVLERDDMKFYASQTLFPFINKLSPNKILYESFRTARIATRGREPTSLRRFGRDHSLQLRYAVLKERK